MRAAACHCSRRRRTAVQRGGAWVLASLFIVFFFLERGRPHWEPDGRRAGGVRQRGGPRRRVVCLCSRLGEKGPAARPPAAVPPYYPAAARQAPSPLADIPAPRAVPPSPAPAVGAPRHRRRHAGERAAPVPFPGWGRTWTLGTSLSLLDGAARWPTGPPPAAPRPSPRGGRAGERRTPHGQVSWAWATLRHGANFSNYDFDSTPKKGLLFCCILSEFAK